MTFNEGIQGKPESLRAWFYPGANGGEEFVHPKDQAVELAKASNAPVLQTTAAVQPEVAKPDAPAVMAELENVPVSAVSPTGQTVELSQVVTAPPPAVLIAQAKAPAPTPSPVPVAAQAAPPPAPAPDATTDELPARFVSGYECASAGQANADMHAWAEVYLPGAGWRGYAPSRGVLAANTHIHYDLTAPVTGGYFGPSGAQMTTQIRMHFE